MGNNAKSKKEEALLYHSEGRPGKIEVIPTKPYSTQKDLSLAYSPGVAEPCLAIEDNPDDAYKYTAKGNLVAVISNGTAVLGLGDIGAMAGKPVMEGKGLLFKTFADIDVFDIEVDTKDTDQFIETVKNISVTFGGINLEDIKAPECFEIEERLKEELSIPVMHDDQHGTAIISSAALLNALEIAGKKIEKVQVVVNGAGAAAVSCAKLYIGAGRKARECDHVRQQRGHFGTPPEPERGESQIRHYARGRYARRSPCRSRRIPRLIGSRRADARNGTQHGRQPDRIRAGQSESGNLI